MKPWMGRALLAVALLGGVFGLTALAIEWRQESTDLGPLATEVAGLASDVAEIRSRLEARSALEPAPPLPTPAPTATVRVVPLTGGSEVESGGGRITGVGVRS